MSLLPLLALFAAAFLPEYRADDWHAGWIWQGRASVACCFRKTFVCEPTRLRLAAAQFAVDDRCEVFLNGTKVGESRNWAQPTRNDRLLPLLKSGENEIFIRAWNVGSSAGLLFELDLVAHDGQTVKIGTGADWEGAESESGPWGPAREFMRQPQPPYGETPYMDFATGELKDSRPPEPAPYVPKSSEKLVTRIKTENGAVHYYENGVERPFVSYRTPSAGVWRKGNFQFIPRFDAAGIRLAEISIPLCQRLWLADGSIDTNSLERTVLTALHFASNMNFVCFFNTDAPHWYVARHPEERFVFSDGRVLDRMSYASRIWREDTLDVLRRTVRFLKTRPYYNRLAGFGLDGGYDGQFMQWTDHGYREMGDYSKPMERLFGRAIPSAERRRGSPERLFLDPVADKDVIDYNRWFGATPAAFMLSCAKAIKQESDGEKIVGAYYGKFYSLAGYLECGEFSIGRVLASPAVDYLVAVEYSQRVAGFPHSLSAPTESYALHDKLFVDEADIRTFLDGQKNWGYAGDVRGTESMIRKMFAHVFTRGHAIHWYDLFGGWFDHPSIGRMIADMQRIAERHCADPVWPKEVALVCDEESFVKSTSAIKKLTGPNLLSQQKGRIARIGAPYDMYFASDLAAAPAHKLWIFSFCFAPAPETQAAIDRIRASGAKCVFLRPEDKPPSPAAYREMARSAGVHLYSDSDDCMVYVGRGLLAVHSGADGERTVRWPRKATFADAVTGELVARDVSWLKLNLVQGETRIFEVKE